MSYTIEVYRGAQKAERHFGIYALYVMYFPQLVAGPIERPQNVLHQFKEEKYFDYARFMDGLMLMFWGLFKKVVIADRLSIFVDTVYNSPSSFFGLPIVLATIFFAIQIYCDFSGYSDIARGVSRIMGIELMVNFNQPYFSKSVSEFWKRWHISLSTWFRDYLYIPLGGNRVSAIKQSFNILSVFSISGLWHGANWTFIIWGFLNGVFIVIENIFSPQKPTVSQNASQLMVGLQNMVKQLFCFLLICITWIFFRANSLTDALSIIKNACSLRNGFYFGVPTVSKESTILMFVLIVFLFTMEFIFEKYRTVITNLLNYKYIVIYLLAITILVLGVFEKQSFIYFQF